MAGQNKDPHAIFDAMPLTRKGKPHHLTQYRRHKAGCKGTKICDCPIWAHGKINGVFRRISLSTRSEEAAKKEINRLLYPDDGGPDGGGKLVPIEAKVKTVEDAAKDFLKAKEDIGIANSTVTHYRTFVNRFAEYFVAKKAPNLRDITTELVRACINENAHRWPSVATRFDALNCCRVWLNFCVDHDWMIKSPAKTKTLSVKKSDESTKKPFTHDEVRRILAAIDTMTFRQEDDRERLRALVLLMLASGQRISDACFAQRANLNARTGVLNYRVIKSRRKLMVPPQLRQQAVAALQALPGKTSTFFFWDGDYSEAVAKFNRGEYMEKALPKGFFGSCINKMQALIERLLRLAGVAGCPHSFRSTFAVNMLSEGTNIVTVSRMLGHTTVLITEKHYLHLVEEYSERMSQSTSCLKYFDRAS